MKIKGDVQSPIWIAAKRRSNTAEITARWPFSDRADSRWDGIYFVCHRATGCQWVSRDCTRHKRTYHLYSSPHEAWSITPLYRTRTLHNTTIPMLVSNRPRRREHSTYPPSLATNLYILMHTCGGNYLHHSPPLPGAVSFDQRHHLSQL